MTELEQSNKLCFIDSNIWLYDIFLPIEIEFYGI